MMELTKVGTSKVGLEGGSEMMGNPPDMTAKEELVMLAWGFGGILVLGVVLWGFHYLSNLIFPL